MNIPYPQEPWVALETESDFSKATAADLIASNQGLRQAEKHRFYRLAFDMLTSNNVEGDYLEFGCHRCRTFRMALTEAKRQGMDKMKFHAFDSFQGLPPDASAHEVSTYAQGCLKTEESDFIELVRKHGIYVDQVSTHKGFYNESLTPTLSSELLARGTKAALVCVDCDLIASTTSVFGFIEPFLQEGALIYIDDYYAGYKGNPRRSVARTWDEFRARHQDAWFFEPFLNVGWWGRSFIVCK